MTVIVTGANGLLGSAICRHLKSIDRAHVGLTRTDVDLLDLDETLKLFSAAKPTAIIHTAARVHGLMGNLKFPVDVFEENTLINVNVVKAGRLAGVEKFVAAGTVAAYPADQVVDISEDRFLDGEPHDGERAYAYSKRGLLCHLEATQAQADIPFAYAILTNLFGPRDRFDTAHGHVIPSLIAKFSEAQKLGAPVDVWGTGRAKRDFLYVKDAAAALVTLLDKGEGLFNVATGNSVAIRSVVDALSKITGARDINWQSDKPEGQLKRSYDVRRLDKLGFRPSWTLEDGLRETFDWYQSTLQN